MFKFLLLFLTNFVVEIKQSSVKLAELQKFFKISTYNCDVQIFFFWLPYTSKTEYRRVIFVVDVLLHIYNFKLYFNILVDLKAILLLCFLINLFIYFWLHWVFVAACGISLVAASGGYSLLQCTGISLLWLLLLRSTGSRGVGFSSCGSRALERRLSSCGSQAQLLRGMWDLPGPGLEPVSPAVAGGFLTTEPPGKP